MRPAARVTMRRLSLPIAVSLLAATPLTAKARAEPGTSIENLELKTLAGAKERLLSAKAKANVFVFFRTKQQRSIDGLMQLAACEKELAARSTYWTAIVSSSEATADVQSVVEQTGIQMPVLIDEGDVLYGRLGVRLHPMVAIANASFNLVALEPYRKGDYCEIIKMRTKALIGEGDVAGKGAASVRSQSSGADPATKAMRDVNMARRLLEIGQYNDSVKFAQRALAVAPVSAAYTVMGHAYAKLGRCAESEKAFSDALKLDPKDPDAAAAQGSCK